jgi:cytochrome bd ubiquinol oxidase subunit I
LTPVLLSRIQFAFTIGYHFLYVPFSIGLGMILILAERRYRRTGSEADRASSDFWIKLFAATFAVGVASGITMEFAFGSNWANYSRFVGGVFAVPLAAEGIFAFFLESSFLGILLFGRKRVSRRVYYTSAWLVVFAAVFSAFWILAANSWMQTPRGSTVQGGKAVLTNFWAALFTPSLAPRLAHTLGATLVAGSFFAAGVSAYYLLRGRHSAFAKRTIRLALVLGFVLSAVMPLLGHWQALGIAKDQPIKLAAMEAVYETGSHKALSVFGVVDESAQKPVGILVPDGLSLIMGLTPNKVITGLNTVPPADRPPVQIVFQSWHLMIAVGILLVIITLVGLYLWWRGRLERSRWYLRVLQYAIPLPILATTLGWMTAEIGRQPWVVQGQLRTTDAVSSTVSTGQVATTLAIFIVLYAVLFYFWLAVVRRIVRKGPEETVPEPAIPQAVVETVVSPSMELVKHDDSRMLP